MENLEMLLLEKTGEGEGESGDGFIDLTGGGGGGGGSMETHMKFIETEDFKENWHWFCGFGGRQRWGDCAWEIL